MSTQTKKATHTQGEWKVFNSANKFHIESINSIIAENITEANAHLISAAPDMLEALRVIAPSRLRQLKNVIDRIDKDYGFIGSEVQDDLLKMAELSEKAIAKAEENNNPVKLTL